MITRWITLRPDEPNHAESEWISTAACQEDSRARRCQDCAGVLNGGVKKRDQLGSGERPCTTASRRLREAGSARIAAASSGPSSDSSAWSPCGTR